MIRFLRNFSLLFLVFVLVSGCASKKKKGEVSKLGKFYHNMTSRYNGYFNANELMKESFVMLEEGHRDNFNELLPVFPYMANSEPKSVASNLDIAIEKVTTVAALHPQGDWVDDCYVLMGKAQFLKQDYESSLETFEYFQEEFNPSNPYGSNYTKRKRSPDQRKKQKEREREEEKKAKEKEKKEKEEARKREKEAKEREKKELQKQREEAKKKREEEKKNRRKKSRSSKKRSSKKDKKEEIPVDPTDTIKSKNTRVVVPTKIEKEPEKAPPKKKSAAKDPQDDTAYTEGLLWLAKTYIEVERYTQADYLLKRISKQNLKDKIRREVAPVQAHMEIKQKNYDEALKYLQEAIETSNKKNKRARYSYIMAQIYQMQGRYDEAYAAFEKVEKYGGSYEFEFNAKLNKEKNALIAGGRSGKEAEKALEKMLKDKKNSEYKDQIYFIKGEIALAKGEKADAIKNFRTSLKENIANEPLKASTYYTLGNLFYEAEDYVASKNYYDSTLIILPKQDERYPIAENYSKNLTEIADNIAIIELQDSLLRLSTLPEEELKVIAAALLLEGQNDTKADDSKSNGKLFSNQDRRQYGVSTFFAYSISVKEKGKTTFRQKWGERKLEDNWRRSEVGSAITFEEDTEEELEEEEKEISDAEMKRVLSEVPFTDEAKAVANEKIKEAMYTLGVQYRSKIQNFNKSVETLEAMNARFPSSDKELDAYYQLYLSYLDLNDNAKSKEYYDLIVSKYPESRFALALKDPNYGKDYLALSEQLDKFYNDTYIMFNNGRYKQVSSRVEEAEKLFGKENTMKAKFALLNAMCLGNLNGRDAYMAALSDIVVRYPDTPEQTRAKEILRFLKGDEDAFVTVNIEEVDDIFEMEDDKRHYLMIVTFDAKADKFTDAKISVSNYNKKYHKLKRLQLADIFLNKDERTQIILVRQFSDKAKAMKYYNEVVKSKDEFINSGEVNHEIFVSTQRNYRKIVNQRSINSYRAYFEKHYLN